MLASHCLTKFKCFRVTYMAQFGAQYFRLQAWLFWPCLKLALQIYSKRVF